MLLLKLQSSSLAGIQYKEVYKCLINLSAEISVSSLLYVLLSELLIMMHNCNSNLIRIYLKINSSSAFLFISLNSFK